MQEKLPSNLAVQLHTQHPKPISTWENIKLSFLCGCAGGIGYVISGHPFDTLKVRMQINKQSLLHNFRSMVGKEGFSALFKGINSPLYNVPLIYACYFGSFELGKWMLGVKNGEQAKWHQSVLAGFFSGLASTFVVTPIELVKCKLQMEGVGERIKRTGAFAMTKQVLKNDGIKGLFRGTLITGYRESVGNAAYFGVYEVLKHHLEGIYGKHSYVTMFSGSIAGLIGWMVIYPQDVIKTRIQLHPERYPNSKYFKDGGILACTREIIKEDGWRGFKVGAAPCAMKGIVAEALTFLLYEETKMLILGKGGGAGDMH